MSSVDKKFFGVASGTMATMRVIGQTLSMGIVMFVFMLFMGNPDNRSNTTDNSCKAQDNLLHLLPPVVPRILHHWRGGEYTKETGMVTVK